MASNNLSQPEGARDLREYILTGARRSGRSLGSGSYGSVEEIEINGVTCAAKKLHDTLIQPYVEGATNVRDKFVDECRMMSKLRHPHIVQFLGVFYSEQQTSCEIPWLVMEFLHSSLHDILSNRGRVPFPMKASFMFDVSKGLSYLHNQTPAVIHRDLTARNVLINSAMVAKIADFGVSRIVQDCFNFQEKVLQMTRVPGNSIYMPPEACSEHTCYSSKLDIFSFGVLTLFCVTQKFPHVLLPSTFPNPNNSSELLCRTEVQRRQEYFDTAASASDLPKELRQTLLDLILACLHNDPAQRPDTMQILAELKEMHHQCHDGLMKKDKLELMMHIAAAQVEVGGSSVKMGGTLKKTEQNLRPFHEQKGEIQVPTEYVEAQSPMTAEAKLQAPQFEHHRSNSENQFQIKEHAVTQRSKYYPLSPKRMSRSRSECKLNFEQFEYYKVQAAEMQKSASFNPTGWYNAILFTPQYISGSDEAWKAVFTVSRSEMFCGQPIQHYLESMLKVDALFPTSHKFQFTCGDYVTLHIPHKEALAQGYTIKSNSSPCTFNRSEVDSTGMDFLSYPPRRILTVRPASSGPHRCLDVELTLMGVAGDEPCRFLLETPDYDAPSALPLFTIGPPSQQAEYPTEDMRQKQAILENKPDRAKFMDLVGCWIPPDKWKLYATQLGLSDREIDEIDFTSKGLTNASSIFLEVFKRWEKSVQPKHTWSVIMEALKSNSVNELSLAWELGNQLLLTDSTGY